MADPRLLTAAELELMHALWTCAEAGPRSVSEVMDLLTQFRGGPPRAYTTVATLLKILEDKGFARSTLVGRKLLYEAAVDRPDYEDTAVRDVVQRVFSGDAAALVRTLVATESLTEADRAVLRALLDPAGTEPPANPRHPASRTPGKGDPS